MIVLSIGKRKYSDKAVPSMRIKSRTHRCDLVFSCADTSGGVRPKNLLKQKRSNPNFKQNQKDIHLLLVVINLLRYKFKCQAFSLKIKVYSINNLYFFKNITTLHI